MMFKVLLLQGLYNLSDAQTEYQIKDRLSFMRFLELSLGDTIPDEKTIWAYREVLSETGVLNRLFKRFDNHLEENGLFAELGHIVDARWTMKSGKTYYGYKNHINIDVKNKLIRAFNWFCARTDKNWLDEFSI